jgi:hypothetical protein
VVLHEVVPQKTPPNAAVAVQSLTPKLSPKREKAIPPVAGRFEFCICVRDGASNVNARMSVPITRGEVVNTTRRAVPIPIPVRQLIDVLAVHDVV